ncbi:MAG TPA: hypothetical protein VJM33_12340 [Microthrixaceae bacterium]|nr:hypothetical protein [Microthrixaceae bacterium]
MRIERREGYTLVIGGPVPPGSAGITIGSIVSVRADRVDDERLLRHELVHVRQWRQLGLMGFLVRYLGSYLGWRLRGYSHWAAYRRIPLECEAEWEARRPRRLPPRRG